MMLETKFDIGDRVEKMIGESLITGVVTDFGYGRHGMVNYWFEYVDDNGRIQTATAYEPELKNA